MAHKNTRVFSHDTVENKLFKASVFALIFFTRRAADVASEACFAVMTGDRHNELTTMDFSMIIFAQTPS